MTFDEPLQPVEINIRLNALLGKAYKYLLRKLTVKV